MFRHENRSSSPSHIFCIFSLFIHLTKTWCSYNVPMLIYFPYSWFHLLFSQITWSPKYIMQLFICIILVTLVKNLHLLQGMYTFLLSACPSHLPNHSLKTSTNHLLSSTNDLFRFNQQLVLDLFDDKQAPIIIIVAVVPSYLSSPASRKCLDHQESWCRPHSLLHSLETNFSLTDFTLPFSCHSQHEGKQKLLKLRLFKCWPLINHHN